MLHLMDRSGRTARSDAWAKQPARLANVSTLPRKTIHSPLPLDSRAKRGERKYRSCTFGRPSPFEVVHNEVWLVRGGGGLIGGKKAARARGDCRQAAPG